MAPRIDHRTRASPAPRIRTPRGDRRTSRFPRARTPSVEHRSRRRRPTCPPGHSRGGQRSRPRGRGTGLAADRPPTGSARTLSPWCSRKRFLLDRVELRLADRAAVEERLRPLDLSRCASSRGLPHVLVHLSPLSAPALEVPLRHPGALTDQVDEHAEVGEHDGEDEPAGLAPAREVMATKDVAEDGEEKPEPEDPEKEDEHRPHHVEKRVIGSEHSRLLGARLRWTELPSHAGDENSIARRGMKLRSRAPCACLPADLASSFAVARSSGEAPNAA